MCEHLKSRIKASIEFCEMAKKEYFEEQGEMLIIGAYYEGKIKAYNEILRNLEGLPDEKINLKELIRA